VTKNTNLPQSAINDLIVASITAKYTQSNSVVYALNGQTIGVGAGQQSRVDCVKLAGSKAEIWWCRQHEKVKALQFKTDSKRVDRTNARIAFIEGEMSEFEYKNWSNNFEKAHLPSVESFLTYQEKKDWLKQLKGVSLSSDAFLPFRDNIDVCSRFGVQYIVHPGGSIQDAAVNEAADEYNMVMAHSGVRLFHH
jgi:phosphoribosylaminoimidazolecarboxamide formyltransferase/IMP cyclohydrolase